MAGLYAGMVTTISFPCFFHAHFSLVATKEMLVPAGKSRSLMMYSPLLLKVGAIAYNALLVGLYVKYNSFSLLSFAPACEVRIQRLVL